MRYIIKRHEILNYYLKFKLWGNYMHIKRGNKLNLKYMSFIRARCYQTRNTKSTAYNITRIERDDVNKILYLSFKTADEQYN